MELYAEVIRCRQVGGAKEFVKKVFLYMRQKMAWDVLRDEYVLQKLCHSPAGNDYVCFCDGRED